MLTNLEVNLKYALGKKTPAFLHCWLLPNIKGWKREDLLDN